MNKTNLICLMSYFTIAEAADPAACKKNSPTTCSDFPLTQKMFGSIFNPKREGWVYVILAEGTNRVKFGRSNNPSVRQVTLNNQSPYPLKLLRRFYTVDAHVDEAMLHKKYAQHRVHGEWFEMDMEWIAEKLHVQELEYEDVVDYSLSWIYEQINELIIEILVDTNVQKTSSLMLFYTNALIEAFRQGSSSLERFFILINQIMDTIKFDGNPTNASGIAIGYLHSFILLYR